MTKETLDAYIDSCRQAMTEDIMRLVAIESISGDKANCDRALDFVLSRAKEFGLRTGATSGHDAGWAETGEGEKTVGVLVHVDVVGIGDRAKWRFPPFEAAIADGFIWGRGTIDDKGPAIMGLYALKALRDLGCKLGKRVRLIIGTSEESEWSDIRSYIAEFGMPDYGFSPDGDFPIYNAEKGYADVELSFSDPAADEIAALSAGDSANAIPSKAVLEWKNGETLVSEGTAAHSSEPLAGDNAILRLAEALSGTKLRFARFLRDFEENEDLCPRLSIDDGSEYIGRERVGRSTAVPTMLYMATENGKRELRLNINIRQKFGVSGDCILSAFTAFSEEYGFTARLSGEVLDGMMVPSGSAFLRPMKEVYEEYGYKAEFIAAPGTSYAKSMPNFVSWGPVFRTDPNCFHVENERLSIATMLIATKMYALYLLRTAGDRAELPEPSRGTSIEKALSLLAIFAEKPGPRSLSELSKRSGMNRTTVYRDLTAFEAAGLVARDELTKTYSVGPLAFRLGNAYLAGNNYEERLLVLLERIAEEVRESVGLARREGNSVMSIYSVESRQPVKMNDKPGELYPMNRGTYGKCLMAYHDGETVRSLLKDAHFEKITPNTLTRPEDILEEYRKIRENGYVLSIEETAPLIIGVGVPIRDSAGGVRNVVAVSFLKREDFLERIERIKSVLLRFKPEIEACL